MNLFWGIACSYMGLAAIGVIQFELWGQVEYLHDQGWHLLSIMDSEQSAHLSRYLLVLPLYYMQDTFSVSADYLFSLLCSFMIVMVAVNLTACYRALFFTEEKLAGVFLLLLFIMLSLMMNGRVIFSLLAFAMVVKELYLHAYDKDNSVIAHVAMLFVALWMSSVSSGTFAVVYFYILYFLVFRLGEMLYASFSYTDISIVFFYASLLAYFYWLLMIFTEKNMSYYGGFWSMLEHGTGKIILQNSFEVIFLILANLTMFICLFGWLYMQIGALRHLLVALLIGLGGGAFGYSTLSMCLIPFPLLLLSMVNKFMQDNENIDFNLRMQRR